MYVAVASASAFVNNTPLVAVMIPIVERWCRTNNHHVSRFMMPLSYAAILGGLCTIIGTSTNLIARGLAQRDLPGLTLPFFEVGGCEALPAAAAHGGGRELAPAAPGQPASRTGRRWRRHAQTRLVLLPPASTRPAPPRTPSVPTTCTRIRPQPAPCRSLTTRLHAHTWRPLACLYAGVIGLPVCVAGGIYITTFSRWLLPKRETALGNITADPREYVLCVRVDVRYSHIGACRPSARTLATRDVRVRGTWMGRGNGKWGAGGQGGLMREGSWQAGGGVGGAGRVVKKGHVHGCKTSAFAAARRRVPNG